MDRMSLFDRARGLQREGPASENDRCYSLESLRSRLGGDIITEGKSSLYRVEYRVPLLSNHGNVSFKDIYSLDLRHLQVLFPKNSLTREISLKDFLFFDIETTGLSGGAGTYVFLIGMLRLDEDCVSIIQYFLNNLSSERLFLHYLGEYFSPDAVIVSYNGKTFDINVLKNRYILNARPFLEGNNVHLDLLYPSRRIWRGMFPDYSLATVEKMAIGLQRSFDIPGFRIPDVYFQYLRNLEVSDELHSVFVHNRNDVLSLLALFIKQLKLIQSSFDENLGHGKFNANCVSDMLIRSNHAEQAQKLLHMHLGDAAALRRLALLCKKQKLSGETARLFKLLSKKAVDIDDYIFACTELAKLYEHRLKDPKTALIYTERMQERLRRSIALYPEYTGPYEQKKAAIENRRKRLLGKIRAD
jgi:uncharacterized protein YprB with RNaseH-like and TPR domain